MPASPLAMAPRIWLYGRNDASGDDSDGSFLRPDQMQARPVLHRRQRAGGSRDCVRDLFHRGRLRSAGEVLRRQGHRHRPFRQREGAGHSRHPGHPHHHHLQGVRRRLGTAWLLLRIARPRLALSRRAHHWKRGRLRPMSYGQHRPTPQDWSLLAGFFGRGGPSTGGSDLM